MTCLYGDVPEGLYLLTQLRDLQLGFHDFSDHEWEDWPDDVTLHANVQAHTALHGLRELTNLTKLDLKGPVDSWMPIGLSCLVKLESFCYTHRNPMLSPGFSLGAQITELELDCRHPDGPLAHWPGHWPGEPNEDVRH